jgi:hypothetical protein
MQFLVGLSHLWYGPWWRVNECELGDESNLLNGDADGVQETKRDQAVEICQHE